MRITTLLQKIAELSAQPEKRGPIDIDLMLDYTRVLYADLLEWRSRFPANSNGITPGEAVGEPTLAELADAMEREATRDVPQTQAPDTSAQKVSTVPVFPATEDDSRKDIRSLISINDKYQIMSELFGNDREAYEQALDFINQSKNEQSAMAWLREQLWITEERSDAAMSFFDVVSRYFRTT